MDIIVLAICHFTLLYKMWNMNVHTTCTCALCGYYNMEQKNTWINRQNPESEEEEGEEEIPLGTDGTGYSERIRARLTLKFG